MSLWRSHKYICFFGAIIKSWHGFPHTSSTPGFQTSSCKQSWCFISALVQSHNIYFFQKRSDHKKLCSCWWSVPGVSMSRHADTASGHWQQRVSFLHSKFLWQFWMQGCIIELNKDFSSLSVIYGWMMVIGAVLSEVWEITVVLVCNSLTFLQICWIDIIHCRGKSLLFFSILSLRLISFKSNWIIYIYAFIDKVQSFCSSLPLKSFHEYCFLLLKWNFCL